MTATPGSVSQTVFELKDIEAHAEDYIIIPGLFYDD